MAHSLSRASRASSGAASARRDPARLLVRGVLALAVAAAVMAGCEGSPLVTESNGIIPDQAPPTVVVVPTVPQPDSAFVSFNVNAADNIGLLRILTAFSGPGVSGTLDTTFSTAVTSVSIPYNVQLSSGTPAGDTVTIVAVATDGAGNQSAPDTTRIITMHATP